jgi:hypothetical protein
MFRQPINATFTLSDGAGFDDQTFDGMTVAAETANAEFRIKFLLDGFIVNSFMVFKKSGFFNSL